MNRHIHVTVWKKRFTEWWTARIDHPGGSLGDRIIRQKDQTLTALFLGNNPGQWVYNHMSANAWTWLRLICSPIPMILIGTDQIPAAGASFGIIWLTDLFDGWFARTKQQVTKWGERFETRVDWIYKLQSFIGVFIHYPDMRSLVGLAGILELIRALGGWHLERSKFEPHPNRSGRFKTPFMVMGIGLRLIYDLFADYHPRSSTNAILLLCNLFMLVGIALSGYSMLMHWLEFQAWKHTHVQPRH
ncbi:MAG: CDP-alcohol phosphatidyltransferase family protein [Candidatus Kerfeldbacteria bacterium]|nr:CDP-alcohol phosphatidyltransferase family protein [Candidatus Kerfeldbacteria bacterium]